MCSSDLYLAQEIVAAQNDKNDSFLDIRGNKYTAVEFDCDFDQVLLKEIPNNAR